MQRLAGAGSVPSELLVPLTQLGVVKVSSIKVYSTPADVQWVARHTKGRVSATTSLSRTIFVQVLRNTSKIK